jgi:hypothetical protein
VSTLAAPLQGSVSLQFKTLSTPGGGASLKVGETWNDSWTFNPSCTGDRCTLATNAEFAPPGFAARPFTVNLTGGTDGAYTGSTRAYISFCGSVHVQDTVILSLSAKSGGVENGAWNSWGGTMDLNSPYVTVGSQYCPAQSWTFSLTGTNS